MHSEVSVRWDYHPIRVFVEGAKTVVKAFGPRAIHACDIRYHEGAGGDVRKESVLNH